MKLRTSSLIGILAACIGTAAVGARLSPGSIMQSWDRHYTDNAYVRGDITQVAPKVSGQVTQVLVRDNQAVKAGDTLFLIDDRDFRARLAQAQAALDARIAAMGNLEAQLELQRAIVRQADAVVREASVEAGRTARDAARAGELVKRQLIATSQFDQLLSSSQAASARVAEAQAGVLAARQRIGVLESQRPQLQADIDAARAALALAALDVESTVVRAPVDGRVSERISRPGQYVKSGTTMIALVPPRLWVVANFKETQLQRMHVGAAVDVTIDAIPGSVFRGEVESLSPASGAQFALLPPDNATGNFTRVVQRIPVRIALVEGAARLADMRPGMSATVRVRD